MFASPSEKEVLNVARAADAGGGVLFLPINYAGDILHFGAARDQLRSDGEEMRAILPLGLGISAVHRVHRRRTRRA